MKKMRKRMRPTPINNETIPTTIPTITESQSNNESIKYKTIQIKKINFKSIFSHSQ
jgi:hypothetical protein